MMKRHHGELPFILMFLTIFFPSISSFYTTPDMFNAGMTTTGMYDMNNFGMQTTTTAATTNNELCAPVNSTICGQYGFNNTATPFRNYPGQTTAEQAESVLGAMLSQTTNCTIPRASSETIACAMYIPRCLPSGNLLPPCSEDCEEVINACRIFDIPGYADALGICTIFPSRTGKECFSLKK